MEQLNSISLHENALEAIREIGPLGVPSLLAEIRRGEPMLPRLFRETWSKLPVRVRDRIPKPKGRNYAREGQYAGALVMLGAPAIPQLLTAFGDPSENVRLAAVRAIRVVGINAEEPAPGLLHLLNDPNSQVRVEAVYALGQRNDRKQFVPLLIGALKDTNTAEAAIRVLGCIGPAAESAVPELAGLLKTGNGPMWVQAAIALCRIRHDVNGMNVLVSELPHAADSSACLEIIAGLGQMGSTAKPAVPVILRMVNDPGWGSGRELLIQAARQALNEIDFAATAELGIEAQ